MIELSMINYLNNILLLLSGIWISGFWFPVCLSSRAANEVFTIKEKAPTRAFFWFKAPTSAVTFKTLLRHYVKQTLTPPHM